MVDVNLGGDKSMTDNKALVPVWTLATEAVSVPDVGMRA